MDHTADLAKLEKDIYDNFGEARRLSSGCSFWNDAGALIAFMSSDEIEKVPSPLRDRRIFPGMSSNVFLAMSRQALFTTLVLIAKYGNHEDFASWSAAHSLPQTVSNLPVYISGLSQSAQAIECWFHVMRALQLLANHRILLKDEIHDDLFGHDSETDKLGHWQVGWVTKQSVERYESLKSIAPLPYRMEAPSQGTLHHLCGFYRGLSLSKSMKQALATALSLGYSLLLLSEIHRIQKPERIATYISADALLANLFDVSIGLPSPTSEELVLGTNTDQPLFFRAYESVSKLLGMLWTPEAVLEKDANEFLNEFIFDPRIDMLPLVSLGYKQVILRGSQDGCVIFDDLGPLIPVLVAEQLLASGQLRRITGEAFRTYVETIVQRQGLCHFRATRVEEERVQIGDIDVGFVKDGCLCLVECKDVSPYPTASWDKKEEILRSIKHKKKGYMGWLASSMKLQEHFSKSSNLAELAAEKGFNALEVKEVLALVVTNRPIFIYLVPEIFLASSIPRVMIIDEFEILLSQRWHDIYPDHMSVVGAIA